MCVIIYRTVIRCISRVHATHCAHVIDNILNDTRVYSVPITYIIVHVTCTQWDR